MRRTSRVCPTPGCPTLTAGGPCAKHGRPSAAARDYGADHRRRRAEFAPDVALGLIACWRCGGRIEPGEAWDLGHDDLDRTITRGPEHAGQCNRSVAGRVAQDRYRE